MVSLCGKGRLSCASAVSDFLLKAFFGGASLLSSNHGTEGYSINGLNGERIFIGLEEQIRGGQEDSEG